MSQKREKKRRKSLNVLNEKDDAVASKILKYCSTVCKGKCCYVWFEKKAIGCCPKLSGEKTCSIYRQRYIDGLPYSFNILANHRGFNIPVTAHCGTITDLLKDPTFPEEIKAECCYAHPELLERDYND